MTPLHQGKITPSCNLIKSLHALTKCNLIKSLHAMRRLGHWSVAVGMLNCDWGATYDGPVNTHAMLRQHPLLLNKLTRVLLVRMSAGTSPEPAWPDAFICPDSFAAATRASHTSAGRKLSHLFMMDR